VGACGGGGKGTWVGVTQNTEEADKMWCVMGEKGGAVSLPTSSAVEEACTPRSEACTSFPSRQSSP